MKKYSIRLILLLVIVSVFVMSCDDLLLTSRLSQSDVDNIAWVAAKAFLHTNMYLEDQEDEFENPFSAEGIGDEGFNFTQVPGIGDEGDRIVITWDNFDVGASILALLEDDDVPENIKDDLDAWVDPGQLIIVDGSADAYMDAEEVDIQMKLKIDDLENEGVPSGTYNIVVTMRGMESEDEEMSITITVNGRLSGFSVEDLR